MNRLKQRFAQIYSLFTSPNLSLKEKIYYRSSFLGLFCLLFLDVVAILNHNHNLYLVLILGTTVTVLFSTGHSVGTHRIEAGANINCAALLFLLIPALSLSQTTLIQGTAVWFIFGSVYVAFTTKGRWRIFFLASSALSQILLFASKYETTLTLYGETVAKSSFSFCCSSVIVSLVISWLIIYETDQYEVENQTVHAQKKKIEELNETENHFFSSMSHEIRTPINAILGFNELTLRSSLSPEVRENANHIQNASRLLLSLVNDILDLSKLKSEKMELVPVNYHLESLLSNVIHMISVRAKEKNLEFHIHVDPNLPQVLYGDDIRIQQILINLLSNAVKYTVRGSVTLSVSASPVTEGKILLYCTVADTGIGIKKANIPYLFDAFKRVDLSENRSIEGTGLGLSIVKNLVTLMDGTIEVNSIYTQGSEFIVKIPQSIVDSKPIGDFCLSDTSARTAHTVYEPLFEAPNVRVLVVDDNEMNLLVTKRLLAQTLVQVDTASSAGECLNKTMTKHYDCILLDQHMPVMDGIECLKAIKRQEGGLCQDTPAIALTANEETFSKLLYQKEGFDDYLTKPINPTLLEASLLNILNPAHVTVKRNTTQAEIAKKALSFHQAQKSPLQITTGSVCDLDPALARKWNVEIIPAHVITPYGDFLDGKELSGPSLLNYMESVPIPVQSTFPSVSEYEEFFAQRLKTTQHVIHIDAGPDLTPNQNAVEAARSFDNVTVVDSGHITGGLGMLVLYAARMAAENPEKDVILQRIDYLAKRIRCTFLVDKLDYLHRAHYVNRFQYRLFSSLMIHPVLTMKQKKILFSIPFYGRSRWVIRHYIRHYLAHRHDLDTRLLFVTYTSMPTSQLEMIREEIAECCHFDQVLFKQANCVISCQCGPGNVGLAYMLLEPDGSPYEPIVL